MRVRYLGILIISVLAVVIGLYPSLLSLGAVVGLVTGAIAVVGLAKPSLVESSIGVRRIATGGATFLALELVALVVLLASTPRRTVHFEVATAEPKVVRIIYNVQDGDMASWLRWNRNFTVPGSGLVYTSLEADHGWYRPQSPHPVAARDSHGKEVPAEWTGGGYTYAAGCELAYDEFTLGMGTAPRSDGRTGAETGWLDSLSAWGVQCRNGRLFRAPPGLTLPRTGPTCYYQRAGGVACRLSPSTS